MRIVSLQPSITVTLAGLGVLQDVVACTRYCKDLCPEVAQGAQTIIQDSWSANAEEILAAEPDLVIASVPYKLESLAAVLKGGVRVLAFAPNSLADVYGDIRVMAALVDQYVAGEKLISGIQDEVAQTSDDTRNLAKTRVYCEEWGKPMIASQRWIAELVEAAGGIFLGQPGKQTSPEAIATADPEVVLAAWCGAGDRVPLKQLAQRDGWAEITAVREHRVYCVTDELFNTPAHTLVGGLRAIRWALHPQRFWRPEGIRGLDDPAPAGKQIG